jgi:hypothetical protein
VKTSWTAVVWASPFMLFNEAPDVMWIYVYIRAYVCVCVCVCVTK